MKYIYKLGPLTIHSPDPMTPQQVIDLVRESKTRDDGDGAIINDAADYARTGKWTVADVQEVTLV